MIKLGQVPDELLVTLAQAADFIDSIDMEDGSDWPAGLVVTIVFDDPDATTFTATVTGPTIAWNVDKAVVDTLIAANPGWARLNYKDGAQDILWAQGRPVIALAP